VICGERVLFVYIGAGKAVYVVGDWNHWRPGVDAMRWIGWDVAVLVKHFPLDARLDYNYDVDSQWILTLIIIGGLWVVSALTASSLCRVIDSLNGIVNHIVYPRVNSLESRSWESIYW
jgi:hypothetical protein